MSELINKVEALSIPDASSLTYTMTDNKTLPKMSSIEGMESMDDGAIVQTADSLQCQIDEIKDWRLQFILFFYCTQTVWTRVVTCLSD